MNLTRTPWLLSFQCPAYVGVYERKYNPSTLGDGILYCYWDGNCWYPGGYSPEEAKRWHECLGPTLTQNLQWRGLTEPQA